MRATVDSHMAELMGNGPAPAAGLSRRAFIVGALGSAGLLGLLPLQAAAAGDAGPDLLFSPDRRVFALTHAGEKHGLVQLLAEQSTAVVSLSRHQFVLPLGADRPLRGIDAAWMASAGQVFVLDALARRLHRYATDGAHLGASQLQAAPLFAASGCADGSGGSFLSLPGDHQIAQLSSGGAVLRRFGKLGTAPGCLNYPTALAQAGDGSLIVANTGNRRIDRFHADGSFAGTVAQFEFMPRQLAVGGDLAAVYDPHDHRVSVLGLHSGELLEHWPLPQLSNRQGRYQALSVAGSRHFVVSV